MLTGIRVFYFNCCLEDDKLMKNTTKFCHELLVMLWSEEKCIPNWLSKSTSILFYLPKLINIVAIVVHQHSARENVSHLGFYRHKLLSILIQTIGFYSRYHFCCYTCWCFAFYISLQNTILIFNFTLNFLLKVQNIPRISTNLSRYLSI